MNVRSLEHLLAVIETGSFSRAAERQHITQSALSRSILTLENDLGARLLDRNGRQVRLTPLGETIAARARRMVMDALELRRSADLLQQGNLGAIRVGLGSGPAALLTVPFLTHMAQHHPDVKVTMVTGTTELQLLQLRERSLDALVVDVRRVSPAPDLEIEFLGELQGGYACRVGHPLLATGRPVTFEDILGYPLASIPLSDEVATLMIERFGPRADPQQSVTLRCNDIPSLLATVTASDAIYQGVLAPAQPAIAAGVLAELKTTPTTLSGARFAIIQLEGRTPAPSMSLFKDFVRRTLQD